MEKILIIEDEESILMALEDDLTLEGYAVEAAADGERGLALAKSGEYDLIILDIMLPKVNGLEVCRQLRQAKIMTPILMLTAKSLEVDKVVGLELGADDYVTKPFSRRELLARVKAVLRRLKREPGDIESYQFGDVFINFKSYEATKGSKKLELTSLEFALLRLFIRKRGEVLHRDDILDEIWGGEVQVLDRTVDTHVGNLRKKIEDDPAKPNYIISIRGVGYKFNG